MRKLTQKLVLSVVTMALVVVALGTSTFAWFTLQNAASVGQFSANVTAGEGIEISLGTWKAVGNGPDNTPGTADDIMGSEVDANSVWYTVIPDSVIASRLETMYTMSTFKLKEVTSTDGITLKQKSWDSQNSQWVYNPVNSVSGGFIEFNLFFRSADTKTIKLDSLVIGGGQKTWTIDQPFKLVSGGSLLTVGSSVSVSAWTAARVSLQGALSTGVYQRAEDLAGTIKNSVTLPETSYASATRFGAAEYYYVKTGTEIAAPSALTIPDAVQLSNTGLVGTSSINQNLVTLAGNNNPSSVVVRVWLEGWDADLFDAVFSTSVSVSMKFSA